MNILIFGDTHGNYPRYLAELKQQQDRYDLSIQIGDHGILCGQLPPITSSKDTFYCGNHDDYKSVASHPNYLGRFGCIGNDIFYVSGGYSPDKASRVPGYSWVEYEELSEEEMERCEAEYKQSPPVVMLTHEPPDFLVDDLIKRNPWPVNFPRTPSRTGLFLNKLFGLHQPQKWFFGHWHYDYKQTVTGLCNCLFECIPADESKMIVHNPLLERNLWKSSKS